MRNLLILIGALVIGCSSPNKGDVGPAHIKADLEQKTLKVEKNNPTNSVVYVSPQENLPIIHYRNEYAKSPKWVVGDRGQIINVINVGGNMLRSYVWIDGEWKRIRD